MFTFRSDFRCRGISAVRHLHPMHVACMLALCAGSAHAAVLPVPSAAFPTIQDALTAAVNGDTIQVAPGTYPGAIDFLGKSVALVATGGSGVTTLDGQFSTNTIVTVNGSQSATIQGFKITSASLTTANGGGVLSLGSNLSIIGCSIESNIGSGFVGSGVYAEGGTLSITGSVFTSNSTSAIDPLTQGVGSALAIAGTTTATVSASSFLQNSGTQSSGAAIGLAGSSTLIVTNTTFDGNTTTMPSAVSGVNPGGAAIYVKDDAQLTVNGGTFLNNNSDSGSGAAIRVFAAAGSTAGLTVSGATFTGNTARSGGGAIAFSSPGVCNITTSTFTANTSPTSSGGAIIFGTTLPGGGGAIIDDCTFRDNVAAVAGAVQVSTLVRISDSIFEGNIATGATTGSFVFTGGSGAIRSSTAPNGTRIDRSTFRNNIVRFNAGDGGGAIRASRGFLAIDACTFENNRVEVNPTNLVTIHGGAVHLEGRTTSTLPVFSVTNSTFRNNTTRDTTLGVGGKGGAIFTTLRQQLTITGNTFIDNTSQNGGHVMVETTPAEVRFSDNSFRGGGAIPASATSPIPNQGGDFGAAQIVSTFASATPMLVDNSSITDVSAKIGGGFTFQLTAQGVTIEDSTFTNVRAVAISSSNGGDNAALNLDTPASTIRRSTFTGLRSKLNGVRIVGGTTASAVVEDVTFNDCDAIPFGTQFGDAGGLNVSVPSVTIRRTSFIDCDGRVGGGLIATGGGVGGVLTMSEVLFENCEAVGNNGGGARIARQNIVNIDRARFVGNSAARGGGLWCDSGLTTITNSLFANNTATASSGSDGGGLALDGNNSHTLINCTIVNNVGGAIYASSASNDALHNSIVWGNTGSQIIRGLGSPSVMNASYSIVQGGYAGTAMQDVDPQFVDAVGGNFRLAVTSPAVDAGDSSLIPAGITLDLASLDRRVDVTSRPDTGPGAAPVVDLGAFETLDVAGCDSIDFNRDGLFPDDADLVDFLSVLAGGACSTDPTPGCSDIDFNNDGLFPDDSDLLAFLRVLAGGECTE